MFYFIILNDVMKYLKKDKKERSYLFIILISFTIKKKEEKSEKNLYLRIQYNIKDQFLYSH